jgi:hypothetical protein
MNKFNYFNQERYWIENFSISHLQKDSSKTKVWISSYELLSELDELVQSFTRRSIGPSPMRGKGRSRGLIASANTGSGKKKCPVF